MNIERTIDVVVVAFGSEPLLEECISAILHSTGLVSRVLLVDNGCTNPYLRHLEQNKNVVILRSGKNLGFAGGVMAAAARLTSEHIALVNSDAIVAPNALALLARAVADPSIGIAMPLVLRRQDHRVNSSGNPLHILGFSWAGMNGAPADSIRGGPVAVASGATLVLRRSVWNILGGLPEPFFLYQEDVDLSVGCHQAGLEVVLIPDSCVFHEFNWRHNAMKFEFAERNRLAMVLTRYPRSILLRLAPLILAVEVGALIFGGEPGTRIAKIRGYSWLARNFAWLTRRRRDNMRRAKAPTAFLRHASVRFDAYAPISGIGARLVNAIVPTYSKLALSRYVSH